MKLSAPVHALKGKAKKLKESQKIKLCEALDQVAKDEGFRSWSHLHSACAGVLPRTPRELFDFLNPGDLCLIAARPGEGKTTLALKLVLEGVREKRTNYFFSLEFTKKAVARQLADLNELVGERCAHLKVDLSDNITADYVVANSEGISEGGIVAIDYLQLLDQKRTTAPLQQQVEKLQAYARKRKCIVVFISQVGRGGEGRSQFDLELSDIHLPNPVDLKLFNKIVFLKSGEMSLSL